MRREIAMHRGAGRVGLVTQVGPEAPEPDACGADLESGVSARVPEPAQGGARLAARAPLAVELAVEHAAVGELGAGVRLDGPPHHLEVPPARPVGVVGEPGLDGEPRAGHDLVERATERQLAERPGAARARGPEVVAPRGGVGLQPRPAAHLAPRLRRRLAPGLLHPPGDRGIGPTGAGEHLQCVTAAEGAHHRRGVRHVAPGDEVLEERQERVVQGNVGRRLRGSGPGEEGERQDEERGAGHRPGKLTGGTAGST